MRSDRLSQASLPWLFCCCGCLPVVGIIKGLLIVVPFSLACTLATTVLSLAYLPHDVVFTYYTLLVSRRLGPNLMTLAMLLLPVPLMLWPVVVCAGTLIASVVCGLFLPVAYTFDEQYSIVTGGIGTVFSLGYDRVCDFHHVNSKGYFSYLDSLRRPRPLGQEAFDISLVELALALVVAIGGVVVDGLLIGALSTLYAPPAFLRALWELVRWYVSGFSARTNGGRRDAVAFQLLLLLPLILFLALSPFLAALVYLLVLLGGVGYGLGSAAVSYRSGLADAGRFVLRGPVLFEAYALFWILARKSGMNDRAPLLLMRWAESLAKEQPDACSGAPNSAPPISVSPRSPQSPAAAALFALSLGLVGLQAYSHSASAAASADRAQDTTLLMQRALGATIVAALLSVALARPFSALKSAVGVAVWLGGAVVFYLLQLLMTLTKGLPLTFDRIAFSLILSAFAVLPTYLSVGLDGESWRRSFFRSADAATPSTSLLRSPSFPSLVSLCATVLASVMLPLDHGTIWQVFPQANLAGCAVGFLAGAIVQQAAGGGEPIQRDREREWTRALDATSMRSNGR